MYSQFQKRLMAWYRTHRRAMPWRGVRDPYRIWLSEVMLQQTRVAAVVSYYRRFLRRFPTVHALARAPQNAVLKHWAGLGYYSRARNLHRAAKEIVAKHNGRFPRTLHNALALPGVGAYTAAAVLSIAYGQPHAVLDGNVARVLARLYAIRGDLRQPRRWQELQTLANDLMRRAFSARRSRALECGGLPPLSGRGKAQAESLCHSPGDWNQAMMELGATVCTPRAPRCDVCPVARWCRAQQLGIANQLPAARRKRATEQIHIAAAVLLDPRGRTLLLPPNGASHDGLFSRMWQFPAVAAAHRSPYRPGSQLRAALECGSLFTLSSRQASEGLAPSCGEACLAALRNHSSVEASQPFRHTVTFRDVVVAPFVVRVPTLPRIAGARTPRLDQLDSLPISSATRKIARRALEHLAANSVKPRSATA